MNRSKSILINSEIIKLITPKTTHIANSKLIENDFNNKIPKNGPIVVPSTKLSENRLIPSLLRSTGVTCRNSTSCSSSYSSRNPVN